MRSKQYLLIFVVLRQVRVAHFEPDNITLTGEGVFPRVIFDLPPDKEDERYGALSKQAGENLEKEKSSLSDKSADLPFRALAEVGDSFPNVYFVFVSFLSPSVLTSRHLWIVGDW